jgi:hypothetical protein
VELHPQQESRSSSCGNDGERDLGEGEGSSQRFLSLPTLLACCSAVPIPACCSLLLLPSPDAPLPPPLRPPRRSSFVPALLARNTLQPLTRRFRATDDSQSREREHQGVAGWARVTGEERGMLVSSSSTFDCPPLFLLSILSPSFPSTTTSLVVLFLLLPPPPLFLLRLLLFLPPSTFFLASTHSTCLLRRLTSLASASTGATCPTPLTTVLGTRTRVREN